MPQDKDRRWLNRLEHRLGKQTLSVPIGTRAKDVVAVDEKGDASFLPILRSTWVPFNGYKKVTLQFVEAVKDDFSLSKQKTWRYLNTFTPCCGTFHVNAYIEDHEEYSESGEEN